MTTLIALPPRRQDDSPRHHVPPRGHRPGPRPQPCSKRTAPAQSRCIPEHTTCGVPYSEDRLDFINEKWLPAGDAVQRAEHDRPGRHGRRRAPPVSSPDGRLYVNTGALSRVRRALSEYLGTNILVVELADVPDLEIGPDPADARWNAEQTSDHHFDGPTPDEALGDGPAADADDPGIGWDERAAESAPWTATSAVAC